jgi:hypothetical protein
MKGFVREFPPYLTVESVATQLHLEYPNHPSRSGRVSNRSPIVKLIYCSVLSGFILLTTSCTSGFKSSASSSTKRNDQNHGTLKRVDAKNRNTLRRLESITWDSVKHQMIWDVSRGEKSGDNYQPSSNDRYEINMDNATMTVNGQSRRFNRKEASNVRILMDFISKYALESTVWWENGEGDPVDGKDAPDVPTKPDNQEQKGTIGSKNIHIVKMQIEGDK